AFLCALMTAGGCKDDSGDRYALIPPTFMGTLMVEGYAVGDDCEAAAAAMSAAAKEVDRSVNINGTSHIYNGTPADAVPLYRLNQAGANVEVELDFHAYMMLKRAQGFYRVTDKLFNPAITPVLELWGIDLAQIELDTPFPGYADVTDALGAYCNYDGLELEERIENGETKYFARKQDGRMKLDLGAQAKGYAADLAIERARQFEKIDGLMINISGNVYVWGRPPRIYEKGKLKTYGEDGKFIVYVANPLSGGEFVKVNTTDISVVTSGDYERCKKIGDVLVAHIVDGVTGLPVNVVHTADGYKYRGGLSSVTIFNESSERADVFATAVMLMGYERGLEFLKEQNIQAALLIGNDLDKQYYFYEADPGGLMTRNSKDSDALRAGFTPYIPIIS
ncbi:MAG: FAD:protein FMN transferase, partial [Firmicutes bacterium]|nr:FAD:protein FMN transferase [Bacillota bacterium]